MNPIIFPMAELKPALTGLGKLIQQSHGLPVLKTIKIERNTMVAHPVGGLSRSRRRRATLLPAGVFEKWGG